VYLSTLEINELLFNNLKNELNFIVAETPVFTL